MEMTILVKPRRCKYSCFVLCSLSLSLSLSLLRILLSPPTLSLYPLSLTLFSLSLSTSLSPPLSLTLLSLSLSPCFRIYQRRFKEAISPLTSAIVNQTITDKQTALPLRSKMYTIVGEFKKAYKDLSELIHMSEHDKKLIASAKKRRKLIKTLRNERDVSWVDV